MSLAGFLEDHFSAIDCAKLAQSVSNQIKVSYKTIFEGITVKSSRSYLNGLDYLLTGQDGIDYAESLRFAHHLQCLLAFYSREETF